MIRIAFDIGGTFTDFVLEDASAGTLRFHKLPTTPSDPAEAVLDGLETLLQRAKVAPADVTGLMHATTVATNAILERKGAATALVTTRGFRDVLIIGREKRYDTYDMYLAKPVPLVRRRDIHEVTERVFADGRIEQPLDPGEVDRLIETLAGGNYQSVAVCLLHAYANADHEQHIGEQLRARLPGMAVSLSSDVSPKFREYERTSTTVANAYIKPTVERYVKRLAGALAERGFHSELFIMQSNGGLVTPLIACESPIRIVESGPAAGVLLCGIIGAEEGAKRVLTFDMGGTTAKLGAIDDGEPAITPTFEVDQVRYRKGSGLPINVPAVELLEIGAGGGSLASTDLGLIRVGPESAGAEPGPACYGAGGTRPTVTDANLVLGYINPEYFNGGAMRLAPAAAHLAIRTHIAEPLGLTVGEAAWGIHTIANTNMERAMRIVSVERGRDPRKYALVAFGGAGPLHAARLARAIGIPKVIVPYGAGVGSAIGMLEANARIDAAVTRMMKIAPEAIEAIHALTTELEARVSADLARMNAEAKPSITRFAYMRYAGQGHEIRVDLPAPPLTAESARDIVERFETAYQAKYGYRQHGAAVEAVDWYVMATLPGSARAGTRSGGGGQGSRAPGESHVKGVRQAYFPELGGYVECPVIDRERLPIGEVVEGPAIIEEREATTVVLPKSRASVGGNGHLVISLEN